MVKRRFAPALIVLCLGLAHAGPVRALQWVKQTVDSTGDVGLSTSLALDSGGRPHVSYYDATNHYLKHAYWSGSGWTTQTLQGTRDVGTHASLALDSSDRPHISYQVYNTGDLMHTRWNGSSWVTQTIDIYAKSGQYNSLELDSSGNAHISYISYNEFSNEYRLMYAHWAGSVWAKETVVEGANYHTSLALDSNGSPVIAYFDEANHSLMYTYRSGASWVQQVVDSANYIDYASLALDAEGNPHIAYYNGVLRYARWNGSSWVSETVDSGSYGAYNGLYASLALDQNGSPRISYTSDTYDLKYAYWNGSSWVIDWVDVPGQTGGCTSLALDANDLPHVSYYDYQYGDLRYAYVVPEPPCLAVLLCGLGGLAWRRRK